MGCLTVRSPVTIDDCLTFGGPWGRLRRNFLYMRSVGEAVVIEDGDGPLALAFLVPLVSGEVEFCLSILPRARVRLRAMARLAQLTLSGLAETGVVVVCHVLTENSVGARLAALVGFERDHGTRWLLKGKPCRDCSEAVVPQSKRRQMRRSRGISSV